MKKLIQKYFFDNTNTIHIQFLRYLFVGGIATVADAGIFYFLVNILATHYLIAQTVGFLAGLVLSYVLSVFWIFQSSGKIAREFTFFALVGIGGLILSYGILYILIDIFNLHYFQFMLAKMIAVVLILFWNFGMRKKFVF